ncbi:MAG: outer membrane lipoprotein-sorting protein [Spirochaetales bacterium]|nr:outer membrane lipoprotein-sorting protein [Spirochaetales bacterium]
MKYSNFVIFCLIFVAVSFFAAPLFCQRAGTTGAGSGTVPTAEEIIRRMQANEVHDTSYAEGRMLITDRFGTRTSTYKSWSGGTEDSLIEFTSAEEMGQKVLRTADAIYLYYPDASEVLRIQGSALRDSLLGSDISYEDMTGGRSLLDEYSVRLLGTEAIDGHQTYKVELTARNSRVAYPKQIIWVDTELYVTRRAHRFSLSDRLLKEMDILEVTTQNGKTYPTRIRLRDAMRSNTQTVMEISRLDIGVRLPANIFSLEELSW